MNERIVDSKIDFKYLPGELNFVDKLLQWSMRPRLYELIRYGTLRGPVIVEFDPTTVCNFNCPDCINMGILNKGEIHTERVLELIDEFHNSGVKGIIFIGGGEPLEHKGMPKPIIYAHKLGMAVGLTTNGSLIHRHLNVISECVQWTRVSVDAATQSTFSLFRPSNINDSFAKVIYNIEQLAKIRQGKVGYSFLLIERRCNRKTITNCNELLEAATLAKNIGCDYFEFKPSVDESHQLIPLSLDIKTLLREQIDDLKNLEKDNFRIIYPKSIEHLLKATSPNQPKSYTTCPTLELRTVVTPSGIYPCPYKRGNQNNLIADPNVRFDGFWLSKERINKTKKINPSIDCLFYCIRHDVNLLINSLSKLYREGVDYVQYLDESQVYDDIFI